MKPARSVAAALILALCACAAPGGSPFELPIHEGALRWGDGSYGVVLVPQAGRGAASWNEPARVFADEGMTVVAVAEADESMVAAAIRRLRDDGIERVAVLAAGDGAAAALVLGRDQPDLVDQLILLSAVGDVSGLGVFPKLFVASEGEEAAGDAERMASEAPGDWNALYLAPGSDSGQAILSGEGSAAALEAIVQRLEERR